MGVRGTVVRETVGGRGAAATDTYCHSIVNAGPWGGPGPQVGGEWGGVEWRGVEWSEWAGGGGG